MFRSAIPVPNPNPIPIRKFVTLSYGGPSRSGSHRLEIFETN